MKVPTKQLEFIKRPDPLKTKPVASVKGSAYHVKPELDLRGERYEDALQRLEKYLDEALLANYHQVSIIHGKGTGALMKAVQNLQMNTVQLKENDLAIQMKVEVVLQF